MDSKTRSREQYYVFRDEDRLNELGVPIKITALHIEDMSGTYEFERLNYNGRSYMPLRENERNRCRIEIGLGNKASVVPLVFGIPFTLEEITAEQAAELLELREKLKGPQFRPDSCSWYEEPYFASI